MGLITIPNIVFVFLAALVHCTVVIKSVCEVLFSACNV